MISPAPYVASTELTAPARSSARYRGHAVYIFAFDLAYEMSRQPIKELLGQPVRQFSIDATKRSPKPPLYFRPLMVQLPPCERKSGDLTLTVERTIKLLPVGAVSITVRVPFEAETLHDLVVYHDLQFGRDSLHDEVRRLVEQVRTELAPFYIRPVPQLVDEEAYTVFCFHTPLRDAAGATIRAESWLEAHRREVAALLTQESDPEILSDSEVRESTSRALSYYETDLVVLDWDAALIVDDQKNLEDTLYIVELANFQLAELEAYDRILDDALERSYRDLRAHPIRSRHDVLNDLREIRIDLARLSDELSNVTKFFGDWHLARIYENLASRFHLSDWHRTVDEKLKTLDELYQLLRHDQNNRWMIILESAIVVLFIIDLIGIFLIGK